LTALSKKTSIWLVVLGVLVALPGAVTFDFAMGEARDMGNDWVKISFPLLFVAGALVTVGLLGLVGKAGIAVGAIATLAGIGFAYVKLDGKVAERQEWDRNRQAIVDASAICRGERNREHDAMLFNVKKHNTLVVYETPSGSDSWRSVHDDAYEPWSPDRYQIQNVALMACVREIRQPPLEKCMYTGGRSLERVRYDKDVRLYALSTATIVFSETLVGGTPRACKGLEEFYGDYKDSIIPGDIPTHAQVVDVLRPYLGR
jgi:hypothetical protein